MTLSDLRIPRTSDILNRAADERERAERLNDKAAYDQFTRLIKRLPGARLCWQLGVLHIDSTSGKHYRVTRGGCSCLNAQRCGRRACWHVACFELLLDMLDTLADTLDMASDPPIDIPDEYPDPTPGGPPAPEYRAIAPRIVASRALVWANW